MRIMNILTRCFLIICVMNGANAQNSSLLFDGQNDKVVIPHHDLFNIDQTFTLEAWINASSWKSEAYQGSIINKDNQGPDSGFAFRAGKTGSLNFVMSVDNSWTELDSGPIMNASSWYHVAAVVASGSIKLLVNGEVVATKSYSGTPSSNVENLQIGESPGFAGRVFDGAIDEVRIWNIARSVEEIAANKAKALTGSEAGLVAYYSFNEGTGNLLTNSATTQNIDGTIVNMAENDWVAGYVLPEFDAGIFGLVSPDIQSIYTRPVRLTVRVQNLGIKLISAVSVSYQINNGEKVIETISGSIAPDEYIDYTFNSYVNLTENDENDILMTVAHEDDKNPLNDEFSFSFVKPLNENTIRILDELQHSFGSAGQTHFTDIVLPSNMQKYGKLLLHISVSCPSGGCDPWDQPAKLSLLKDAKEYELARFVTPYGKACGPWTVDVTDFKTLMEGLVTIQSYIQVWGSSGWNLTVDLEMIENEEENLYQKIIPLWGTDYWVYGDPGISHDLETLTVTTDQNTKASHLRMTISGHGQGNTDNAAEFSEKTHQIVTNGVVVSDHVLWKDDCDANSCSDQAGTWLYARAGWCPGQAVEPYIQNLTNAFQPGTTSSIDYELEDYTNTLNTDYDGGAHTEPHYKIWAYYVETSNVRYDSYTNINCNSITVKIDTTDSGINFGPVSFSLTNEGSETVSGMKVSCYINDQLAAEETIDTSVEAGSQLNYDFSSVTGFIEGVVNEVKVIVEHDQDQNLNDNAALLLIEPQQEVLATIQQNLDLIQLYPNPSSTGHFSLLLSEKLDAELIEVYNLSGKAIRKQKAKSGINELQIKSSGTYILSIKDIEGKRHSQKIIVSQ